MKVEYFYCIYSFDRDQLQSFYSCLVLSVKERYSMNGYLICDLWYEECFAVFVFLVLMKVGFTEHKYCLQPCIEFILSILQPGLIHITTASKNRE